MRNAIVVVFGALTIVACSQDKPAETVGITTTTRAQARAQERHPATVDEIRAALIERQPGAVESINALAIRNENGIVTMRGTVEDETMHAALLDRVRAMPTVRGVRDELHVRSQHPTEPIGAGPTATDDDEENPSEGATMGSEIEAKAAAASKAKIEAVRHAMQRVRPNQEMLLRAIKITEDNPGTLMISGTVPDDATREALVKAAKETPGVKNVTDDLKVQKREKKTKKP